MANYKLYSSEHLANVNSCCPEAISEKDGVFYVEVDYKCDCTADIDVEYKEIKPEGKESKEFKPEGKKTK